MKKSAPIFATASVLLIAGVLVAAQKQSGGAHEHHAMDAARISHAAVVLTSMQGSKVQGTMEFSASDSGVMLTGQVTGLTPGKHGFHIHEFGDLRDPAGKSAGGHYNPQGHEHGGPHSDNRHVGDLGNIVAGDDGVATIKINIPGLNLHHVIGRSIVVHAKEDDLKSQPSGDAGDRVAVGVIGIAAAPKMDK